jgi:hypothetical protein
MAPFTLTQKDVAMPVTAETVKEQITKHKNNKAWHTALKSGKKCFVVTKDHGKYPAVDDVIRFTGDPQRYRVLIVMRDITTILRTVDDNSLTWFDRNSSRSEIACALGLKPIE